MGIWKSIAGQVTLRLTGAAIGRTLANINKGQIAVYQVTFPSELCAELTVEHRYLKSVEEICEKAGDRIEILRESGLVFTAKRLLCRPVLIFGYLLMILSAILIPRYVFFFRVEGNERLPETLILEKAEECGLHFAAERRLLRSEVLKNRLLGALPELQWAGVNTYGCVAVISVKERTEETSVSTEKPPTGIVAVRDAVVRSCTVTRGSALCRTGQSVQTGQLLISGIVDCDRIQLTVVPEGEIIGDTCREMTLLYPMERLQRQQKTGAYQKIQLIVGKKQINLWESRGLSGGCCDKIEKNYPLILFGRFTLPVSFVVTTECAYETSAILKKPQDLQEDARNYMMRSMLAGTIRDSLISLRENDRTAVLYGSYFCTEMIGRVQSEELSYHENNREDRQR